MAAGNQKERALTEVKTPLWGGDDDGPAIGNRADIRWLKEDKV
jgi:hypothetical protein